MTTKADKSEIDEIVMLHVDVDPPKRKDIDLAMEQAHILDRLKGYHPPPSIIIGSGGGYWGLWLLREPVPVRDAAHADELALYNLALAEALGGDTKARDISRIARLPGTINLPNAEKRKAGRVPALATFEFYPDRVPTSPQHRHRRLVSARPAQHRQHQRHRPAARRRRRRRSGVARRRPEAKGDHPARPRSR